MTQLEGGRVKTQGFDDMQGMMTEEGDHDSARGDDTTGG